MDNIFNKILAKKAVSYRFFIVLINIIGYLFVYPFVWLGGKFSKNRDFRNIAIMRPDNIGDLVMITPMIEPIKEKFPKSELIVICQTYTKSLIKNDKLIKISEFNPFWLSRRRNSLIDNLKYLFKNFRKYDLLFEVRGDPLCIFFSFFLAKKRVGFSDWGFSFLLNESFEWKDEKHRVDNNLKLLSYIMNEKEYEGSEQRLIVNSSKKVDKFLNKARNLNKIIIHPFTGQKQRDFPLKLLDEMIIKLGKNNYLFITGSKKDFEVIEDFLTNDDYSNVSNVCGEFNLSEFSKFVSECDLIICPDTSIAHISSTFKKPLVGLYGQKKNKTFYPFHNPNSMVLLNQNRCNDMVGERCKNSNCEVHMKDFKVEEVFKSVKKVYKSI